MKKILLILTTFIIICSTSLILHPQDMRNVKVNYYPPERGNFVDIIILTDADIGDQYRSDEFYLNDADRLQDVINRALLRLERVYGLTHTFHPSISHVSYTKEEGLDVVYTIIQIHCIPIER